MEILSEPVKFCHVSAMGPVKVDTALRIEKRVF
jgi:hypothetical protein